MTKANQNAKISLAKIGNISYSFSKTNMLTPCEKLLQVSEKLNLPTMEKDISPKWTTAEQWLRIALLSLNYAVLCIKNVAKINYCFKVI